jgi:hypothetical protein
VAEYEFDLIHKPGKDNIVPDALSRRPDLEPGPDEKEYVPTTQVTLHVLHALASAPAVEADTRPAQLAAQLLLNAAELGHSYAGIRAAIEADAEVGLRVVPAWRARGGRGEVTLPPGGRHPLLHGQVGQRSAGLHPCGLAAGQAAA